MASCPGCGSQVPDDAKRCWHCNIKLRGQQPAASPPTETSLYCSNCNGPLDEADRYCPSCGARILKEDDTFPCPACGAPMKGNYCVECGTSADAPKKHGPAYRIGRGILEAFGRILGGFLDALRGLMG